MFNHNVDNKNVENIEGLYNKMKSIRTVSQVNKQLYNGETIVTGDKILRTIFSNDNSTFYYTFSNLYSWIGSNKDVKWEEDSNGSEFITWPNYNYYINSNNKNERAIEWRMLEGKFKLTDEQMNLISSKKVQPVLGISTNFDKEFETIVPFGDIVNIFVNKKITRLNYVHSDVPYKLNMDKQLVPYIDTNKPENIKFCDKESHKHATSYIGCKHIDLNALNRGRNTYDNYYKMYGDISDEIIKYKNNRNEYEVQVLVGQFSKDGNYNRDDYGGIGKLDLFLIENPQVEVNIKPYIFDNNKKAYKDPTYKFSYNEKVYYDIEIINKSTSYDFTNLDLNIDFLEGEKVAETLKINKEDVIYKGKSIKDNIKVYINDSEIPANLSDLSLLKQDDRIIISGENINHTVSEYEGIVEKINYKYSLEFNYIDDHFFYKYENTNNIGVNPLKGRLTIIIDGKSQDEHYVKISGQNNSANIKIKGNKPYTVFNLDYDTAYKVYLLDSCSYKSIDQTSVTLNSNLNSNKKTITLKPSPKSHKYFIQRKSDSIILNR